MSSDPVSPNVVEGTPLAGSVATVTGGGRGIGRAAALHLARAGAAVAVLARSAGEVAETAAEIEAHGGRALGLAVDVTDPGAVGDAVATVTATLGEVDLLVNNAGTNSVFGPVWEVDVEAWWRDVAVNLRGPFVCARAVLASMVARGSGRIVNIASGTAGRAFPHNSAYAASKAALVRFTDCLAAEVADRGVRVFALGPGTIRTEISLGLERSEEGRRWLGDVTAALRFIPVEFPAWAIVMLASGAADALSGRWVDSADDIAAVAARADEVSARDLYQLRRLKL